MTSHIHQEIGGSGGTGISLATCGTSEIHTPVSIYGTLIIVAGTLNRRACVEGFTQTLSRGESVTSPTIIPDNPGKGRRKQQRKDEGECTIPPHAAC
jgi:hypothetical protein